MWVENHVKEILKNFILLFSLLLKSNFLLHRLFLKPYITWLYYSKFNFLFFGGKTSTSRHFESNIYLPANFLPALFGSKGFIILPMYEYYKFFAGKENALL